MEGTWTFDRIRGLPMEETDGFDATNWLEVVIG
jgi:hypothetical protein